MNFVNYYLSAMTGGMKEIWQTDISFLENIIYYPKYSFTVHMGTTLSVLLVLIGIMGMAAVWLGKVELDKTEKDAGIILAAAFVIPYCFLMISNKQPLVISIWNGVFILVVLFIISLTNLKKRSGFIVLTGIVLICGMGNYIMNVVQHYYAGYAVYDDKDEIWILNKDIANWAVENNRSQVSVLLDRWNDVVSLESLGLSSAENEQKMIEYVYAIDCMNDNFATVSFEENELVDGLENADVIIVAERGYNYDASFPTDRVLDGFREQIYLYAEDNLELLNEYIYRGNRIKIYTRRQIGIASEWADWMGQATLFDFLKKEGDEQLIIKGPYMEGIYEELQVQAVYHNGTAVKELGTNLFLERDKYEIHIDITEVECGNAVIELDIDNYYVPSQISDSSDSRELSLQVPQSCFVK